MRICTTSMFAQELALLTQQYTNIGNLQLQISTGKQIQKGSEDPIRASRISAAQTQISQLETYKANTTMATNRSELLDVTMNSVVDQLKQVKELLGKAANGTLGDSDRYNIGTQLSGMISAMAGLANTQDSDGEYIFGGYAVNTTPFVSLNGNYVYQGSYESSQVDLAPNVSVIYASSGFDVFGDILQGNGSFTVSAGAGNTGSAHTTAGTITNPSSYVADTYTISFVTNSLNEVGIQVIGAKSGQVLPPPPATLPGQAPSFTPDSDIQFNGIDLHIFGQPQVGDTFTVAPSQKENLFNTLTALVSSLQQPTSTPQATANFRQILSQTTAAFDQIFDHVVAKQSLYGLVAKQVTDVSSTNEAMIVQQTAAWSSFASADLAQVSTQLMEDMTSLQAAQQTYVKIQQLFLELLKL